MKIYNTQEEVDNDIIDGLLKVNGDVKFTFGVTVNGNIKADNINAGDINAGDIKADNIDAGDINAWDVKADNINAHDIYAGDINAGDISFYAVCFAHRTFKCKSIKGRRENSKFFCLDSEIEYKKKLNKK